MATGPGEALIGRTIAGKYAVESLLGSGAMGEVYKARQIALEKTIALKVMHKDIAADPSFAQRFHREAKAASRLDHPNSIRVIDFGEEPDGLTYIAMEYVDGRDLLKVITTEWPLSAARISTLLLQALSALSVAHELGVIHRDLKPENIMIIAGTDEDGRPTDVVKVCDFGIAKITARSNHKPGSNGPDTTQGVFVGTPEYVSPEQGKGEPIDVRSDLYSMGVILFQLLTGRVPFEADNPIGVVLKHITDDPPLPSQINPAIDRRLEAVCLKAMRKRREDRYQTAREFRADLRTVLEGAAFSHERGSLLTPTPSIPVQGGAAHAATLQASSMGALPDGKSVGTPSGIVALPEIPVERSRWATIGLVAGVLAVAGLVGVTVTRRAADPPPADPAEETRVAAAAELATAPASATAGSPSAPSGYLGDTPKPSGAGGADTPADPDPARPPNARSAPDPEAIIVATPKVVTSAGSVALSSAPVPPRSAPLHPGGKPLPPHEPEQGSAAMPEAPAPAYSPATAGASVQVTKATGASAAAVRAALPAWNYTACYQDGLKHAKRRIEGRTVLQLTFGPSGFFTHVSGLTSTAELKGVANCVFSATLSGANAVQGADPAGGTAEAVVVYSPE